MNKRTVYGLLIVGIGLIALAGSLGYYEVEGLWRTFWPVILIAFGLANLVEEPRNIVISGLMTVVGVVFLLRNLGYEYFEKIDIWAMIWPLVIIFIGVTLLTSRSGSRSYRNEHRTNYGGKDLDIIRIFSGEDMVVNTNDFRGGDVVTVFGGVNLDLRNASVQDRPARIDMVCIFGGADIKVPEDWHVKITGVPIFGGWGNKTILKTSPDRPVDLEISAVVIFGGMDVKH